MIQRTLQLVSADAYVPSLAPLVILVFLGAVFLLACAAIGSGVAAAARRFSLAKGIGAAGLAVGVVYATVLAGVGLVSRERTLSPGERKYFCEMDCHLAYDVVAIEAPDPAIRIVTVRTWFDPATIAAFRGNGPLRPNPRTVWLVDDFGHRYVPSATATRDWEKAHGASTPLDRELRPGESYTTTLVFAVPPGTRASRLFLGDEPGPQNFLIGHENGPFHAKAYFALPAPTATPVTNSGSRGGPVA